VRRSHLEASAKPIPVHLRGIVTYSDSAGPNLFVEDSTGGVWIDLRGKSGPPPRPGQFLDLRGVVASGFTPYVAKPQWKVIGSAPMPTPQHLSYEQAATGAFDSRWVEMEGIVRSFVQEKADNILVIDVVTPTGAFKVRVPGYRASFPMQLVDAKVQFRGVCGAAFNTRSQLVAIHLLMPGLEYAKVTEAAPLDPYAVPATPISQIGHVSDDLADIHRVKVVGIITARFPQRGFFLMDSTGGLYAESEDGTPADVGDEVEVIGFPAAGSYSTVLKSAFPNPTGRHRLIAPAVINGSSAMKGGYDAQLVTIVGTVQGVNLHRRGYSLVLQSEDGVPFEASFGLPAPNTQSPQVGSKLKLTGICSIKANDNGSPAAFEIVLRSPQDIRLLSAPAWLTGRRAAYILILISLLAAAVLGWVFILRKRVRKQTELIKARLENEVVLEERYRRMFERNLTGLYVAQADGRIIACNETCAQILGYPSSEALLENRPAAEAVTAQFHAHLHDHPQNGAGQIINAEHRFQRSDGSWRSVLVNIRIVHPSDKAPALLEAGLVDISDRKAAEEQVKFLAYYDSLTGLPNRSLLKDRLAKALAAARRHKEKLAILFLDLDRFKNINDSLGHSFGDLLLQEVARRLRKLGREEDTIARVGGDEFLITLTSIKGAPDAAAAAERILKAMEDDVVFEGHSFNVGCSIGISIYPEHGEDDEALIKNADAAMYCAKQSGSNTYRFFTDELNVQVVERLQLESSLRVALDRNEFHLVYQPQINMETRHISGMEALLRWRHPEMGLVPPNRFIPVAESSGLIVSIGEWVLRTACAQAKAWQDAGLCVPVVAVNVSAVQFRQERFCAMLRSVLNDTRLAPECLELELTESLLLSNADVTFTLLEELKNMGIKLAIDDFGTGYSSLSYLRQFPVSKLKIDGSFIRDLASNSDDAAITSAIINMAKALNLLVIAECVETEAQFAFLHRHHCDEMQGYYFSKPLPPDEMAKLMQPRQVAVAVR
jgi:diguanylate cyclase (GGDEF)-like protein/PAS domain S-box-containing protein